MIRDIIIAIDGHSGCGKSTLLRSFNRMNDFILGAGLEGKVLYRGIDLYGKNVGIGGWWWMWVVVIWVVHAYGCGWWGFPHHAHG